MRQPPMPSKQQGSKQMAETAKTKVTKGWGVIRPGDRKAHYYRDMFSLCGRVGFYNGDLGPDQFTSTDDCAACRKVLEREKKVRASKRECPVCKAAPGKPCHGWDCERIHIAVERERLGYHPQRLGEETADARN